MASAYLLRTPTSNSASRTAITVSMWIKRSGLGALGTLFHTTTSNSGYLYMALNVNDQIDFSLQNTSYTQSAPTGFQERKITNRRLRDTNGWYHIVCTVDTSLATATDRLKIYINGEQETSWSHETNNTQQNQALPSLIGSTSYPYNIGRQGNNTYFYDGSISHFHYVDGTAYGASTFGETDTTTGIWKPKTSPSVSYGTNGYFLKFDNSGNMGLDSSGNSNNFTTSGTIIQNKDTPSNVFATMNPLHFGTPSIANAPLTDGNNNFSSSEGSGVYPYYYSTLGVSKGKYYAEFKFVNVVSATAGIGSGIADQYHGNNAADYSYYNDGRLYNGGSSESTGYSALSNGDILGCALDLDNNKVYFHINGSYQASGNPATGAGGKSITAAASNGIGFYHFAVGDSGSTAGTNIQTNFGNGYFGTTAVTSAQNPDDGKGIFEYDVPAGYRALCTESINAQEYS